MKRCLFLLVSWLPLFAVGEDVVRLEYFIDSDPGFGNGIEVTITEGETVDASFSPDLSGLGEGMHFIYIRAQNNDTEVEDQWSPTIAHPFVIEPDTPPVPGANEITALEYFIGTESSGIGSENAITVNTPGEEITVETMLDSGMVANGMNFVYVRAKNTAGFWGPPAIAPVVSEPGVTVGAPNDIIAAEYFIDGNVDEGGGVPLTVSMNGNEVTLSGTISLSGTADGFHTLNIRVQQSDGTWGSVYTHAFLVQTTGADTNSPDIMALEYFIGTDPGVGNGTSLTVGTAANEVMVEEGLDFSGVDYGFQVMNIRAQNADGFWGPVVAHPVFVEPNVQTAPLPNIVAFNYKLYEDGVLVGQGTFNDFTPDTVVDVTFDADSSGLGEGSEFEIQVSPVDANMAVGLAFGSGGNVEASYEQWLATFFNEDELLDDAVSGFLADPDGDGVSNGIEFALRTHPREDSAAQLPYTQQTGGFMEIVYRQRKGGTGTPGIDYEVVDGVRYTVQISDDLSPEGWTDATSDDVEVVGTPSTNGDGTETVTLRYSTALLGQERKFMRLVVTLLIEEE